MNATAEAHKDPLFFVFFIGGLTSGVLLAHYWYLGGMQSYDAVANIQFLVSIICFGGLLQVGLLRAVQVVWDKPELKIKTIPSIVRFTIASFVSVIGISLFFSWLGILPLAFMTYVRQRPLSSSVPIYDFNHALYVGTVVGVIVGFFWAVMSVWGVLMRIYHHHVYRLCAAITTIMATGYVLRHILHMRENFFMVYCLVFAVSFGIILIVVRKEGIV